MLTFYIMLGGGYMFFRKKKKHTETAATIKARKIKIGWGKFAVELSFRQLIALIITVAVCVAFIRGGLYVKTKWFTYNKPPTTHILNQSLPQK